MSDSSPARPIFIRAADRLSGAVGLLAALCLVFATGITAWGVFVRYVLQQPTVWQTESTVYLLIAVTFLGAAYGVREHAHVGVDFVPEMLRPRARLILRMVTTVLVLAVVLVVMWSGWGTWHQAYKMDHHSSSAWGPPLWIPYAFLPLGMALVALQYLAHLVEGALALAGRFPIENAVLLASSNEASQLELADSSDDATVLSRLDDSDTETRTGA